MPFDRLVRAVDGWAGIVDRHDVYAQVGFGGYVPSNFPWVETMSGEEFRNRIAGAEVVVSHAGTGTILTALEIGTPIVVMPRLAALRETRNDHQVATAQKFRDMGKLLVIEGEQDLTKAIAHIDRSRSTARISPLASAELINAIARFIFKN